ncbi:MFS transporter [Blastococcus goldschmidtiae]|uniref:MFS transporter n=1 Tax=Blastococcus goldschmidtiae TaxID=3075546 RepID=A0ABU2K4F1_9ACTN|nr:MFS transporter [Blastococcus sp. DSM 46792]MDT0275068.1 MFS transporter [Blastococcus sp. DSM 46792]
MSTAPTAHEAERTTPLAGRREWLGLVVLMLPVLLISIDGTVLTFAVPSITRALAPSGTELLWAVDIYPLLLAGLLVTAGSLGDRFGRRRLLLLGAVGFGVASVLAAYAPDVRWLIAARALQGVFGAALMPSTLSLLRNLFLDQQQRRLAIAVWASGFAGGAALGPVVGDALLEHFWWGSVFLVNVPVLAVLLLAARVLPESKDPSPGRLDLVSVVLSLTTMLPLVYAITSLASGSPGLLAAAAAALGLGSGIGFVRRQLSRSDPLLDLSLFSSRVVTAAISANLLSIAALSGLLLLASQYLQLVLGRSPMDAGLLLVPGLAASVLGGLAAVPLARRFAVRRLVVMGLLLGVAGYAVATRLGTGTSPGLVVLAFGLVAAGAGLAETLTNDAILTAAPPERAGQASAVSETAYELGTGLGVAVLGSVLGAVYAARLVLPAGLDAAEREAAGTLGGAFDLADRLPADPAAALTENAREAFTAGMDLTAGIGVGVMLAAAALVALVWRTPPADA